MVAKSGDAVISAVISRESNDKLESLANMMRTSKSALIRWAIEEYLAKKLSLS